jgi:hypothetical protein
LQEIWQDLQRMAVQDIVADAATEDMHTFQAAAAQALLLTQQVRSAAQLVPAA